MATLRYHMRLAKKRAGIEKPRSFHILRHTCGTWLHANKVPLGYIQKILRHADIKTTMGYVHSNRDAIAEAMSEGLERDFKTTTKTTTVKSGGNI